MSGSRGNNITDLSWRKSVFINSDDDSLCASTENVVEAVNPACSQVVSVLADSNSDDYDEVKYHNSDDNIEAKIQAWRLSLGILPFTVTSERSEELRRRQNNYLSFIQQVAPCGNEKTNLAKSMFIFDEPGKTKFQATKKLAEEFDGIVDAFYSAVSQFTYGTTERLDRKESMIIGEVHEEMEAKAWMLENIINGNPLGIKTLYLEHLFYDYQHLLDHFFETGELAPELKDLLSSDDMDHRVGEGLSVSILTKKYTPPYKRMFNYTELIVAARNNGIRIVALDTMAIYNSQSSGQNCSGIEGTRKKYFNYVAACIIEHDQIKNPGKFIALVGNSHVGQYYQLPGIADLTGASKVYINRDSALKAHETSNEVGDYNLIRMIRIKNARIIRLNAVARYNLVESTSQSVSPSMASRYVLFAASSSGAQDERAAAIPASQSCKK